MQHSTMLNMLLNIKVAIAEDHLIFREGLKKTLEDVPEITVIIEADNGQVLLQKIIEQQPHVILMDINMPNINGVAATEKVKALFPEIQIIALTANDDYETLHLMNKAGARGYLMKTSDKAEIVAAINAVYDGKSYYCGDTKVRLQELLENDLLHNTKDLKTYDLNERELQVIKLLCDNNSTKQIASIMDLSVRTIEGIKGRLQEKLKVPDTVGIVLFAIKHKIVKI